MAVADMSTDLALRHPLADACEDGDGDYSHLIPGSAEAKQYGCICSHDTHFLSIGCILHRERAIRERAGRDYRRIFSALNVSRYVNPKTKAAAEYIAFCAGVAMAMADEILADATTLTYYYRIASKLTHPDRVEDKDRAHLAFIKLKDSYEAIRSVLR